jgi:hypothetical protein
MGVFNLVGIGCYSTTIILVAKNGRSGDDYDALFVCAGIVQNVVYPKLDLPVLCRGSLGLDLCGCGSGTDCAVLGFLLDLLHQGSERKEVCFTRISILCRLEEGYDEFAYGEWREETDEKKIREIITASVPRWKVAMQCMDGVGGSNFDSTEWSFILPLLFGVQYVVTCIDFITTTTLPIPTS